MQILWCNNNIIVPGSYHNKWPVFAGWKYPINTKTRTGKQRTKDAEQYLFPRRLVSTYLVLLGTARWKRSRRSERGSRVSIGQSYTSTGPDVLNQLSAGHRIVHIQLNIPVLDTSQPDIETSTNEHKTNKIFADPPLISKLIAKQMNISWNSN